MLPDHHACRVWAVEAVECMLDCTLSRCEDTYFATGRGPIFPLGIVFNDYDCAVCGPCADACAGTPSFALVCNPQ